MRCEDEKTVNSFFCDMVKIHSWMASVQLVVLLGDTSFTWLTFQTSPACSCLEEPYQGHCSETSKYFHIFLFLFLSPSVLPPSLTFCASLHVHRFGDSTGSLVISLLAFPTKWIILIGALLSTIGAGLQTLTG